VACQAEAQQAKDGARGRVCTCTGDALDVVSLLLDYASKKRILQPVLPRQGRFTKATRRLLRGGEQKLGTVDSSWSQSPVLPRAQRAYETCLSAGSTAVLPDGHQQFGALTWSCTGLIRLPSECIANNALRAKMASLTGFAPVSSCLRIRRVGSTTPQRQKWWGRRVLPSLPLACRTSALLMSYGPEMVSPAGFPPAT